MTEVNKIKKTKSTKVKVNKSIVSYPDSWKIEDYKGKSFLVFYKEETPIMKMELNPESAAPLIEELNDMFILESDIADSWTYRSPQEGKYDFLTLFREGKAIGSLPVDSTNGIKLWLQLGKFKPKVETKESLKKWAKKHKITATLAGLIIAVVFVYPFVAMIIDFIEGYI